MPILRRYLSLLTLLFWQGGFLFYTIVVIPAAGRVLDRHLHLRAQITDEATNWLNGAGVLVLVLLLWDAASSADSSRRRKRGRAAAWAVLFFTLAALFALHWQLDRLDPPEGPGPTDTAAFNVVHWSYVATAVVQCVAALTYLGLAVSAWRAEDGKAPRPNEVLVGDKNENQV